MADLNFNRTVKSSIDIEQNEEKLHQVYDYTQIDDELNVIIGLDGGSTQTRCCILSSEHQEGNEVYVIPSTCALVGGNEIKCVDETLYSNMDTSIMNLSSEDDKIDKKLYFKTCRIIRGTKLFNEGIPPTFVETNLPKVHADLFYQNIVDAIGYTLVQSHQGAIPRKVNVKIGVALPNNDNTPRRIEHFKSHICGSYIWQLRGKVEIYINIVDAVTLTEPEAFFQAYSIESELEPAEYQMQIEVGGRSSGVEIFRRGIAIQSASKEFNFCGSYLVNKIQNDCKLQLDKDFSVKQITSALKTGLVKQGKNTIDITAFIKRAKDLMANELFKAINKSCFDNTNSFKFEDIEVITFSGRAFNKGDYDYSLAEELIKLFNSRNPGNIDFEVVSDNFIPLGLLYQAYGDDAQEFLFAGTVEEDDEDEVSSSAEVASEVIDDVLNEVLD